MLVNSVWLSEYLEPVPPEGDLLKAIVSAGLEIEGHHRLADELDSITVGFIREKTPLPGADGMFICRAEVQNGESLQVVCASEHPVEIGWGVPVGRGGTKLPTGIQLKNERFHGVLSQGMICLDSELGILARGSGLQVFHDESATIGRRLVDLIDIPDTIFDIKVSANRADCLGLVGIAREIAAILGLSLKLPQWSNEEENTSTKDLTSVEIEEPALCPRYMCRIINGVLVAKSPPWLLSRIRSTGSNPINNIVDVTNFVMREWGQPLHAFDFRTLNGPRIVVRKMRPEEHLRLLDKTIISGESTPLVIADAERPVALAGIMGGAETQINGGTVDVLLEAANFDRVQIKKSLKALNLESTDASYRFERGMDPNETLEVALERAASLIMQVAGGTLAREPLDMYMTRMEPRKFYLPPERVNSFLGTELNDRVIKDCFQRLGMETFEDHIVQVPTRRLDINNEVVLIEDVARLTGYDQIPLMQPTGNLTAGTRNTLDSLRMKVTRFMANNGFLECRNISLESPRLVSTFSRGIEDAVKLVNAKEEISVLRKSLMPGLLETVGRNARREQENFRFFELDRTFRQPAENTVERWSVAAALGGLTRDVDWSSEKPKIDFFYSKGLIESLLEVCGVTGMKLHPTSRIGFRDGQTAEIRIASGVIGTVGAIEKKLLAGSKIKETIYGFEINLQDVLNASTEVGTFSDIPRVPAVVRDIAMIYDKAVPFSAIESTILGEGGDMLENVSCIDVYEGKHVQQGHRSISVRLRFRDRQRTLSTDEVSLLTGNIIQALEQEYSAKLRE
jgi:phenylalanyl-tRNA synthetase beta chain